MEPQSPNDDSVVTLLASAVAASERGDEDARWTSVVALQRGGAPETFEACATWCASASGFARTLAADVLGQLGGSGEESPYRERSTPLLLGLLSDSEPSVISSAAIALGHLAVRGRLEPLLSLAAHRSAEVRHAVAVALSGNESARAIATLILLSADEDAHVRDWATFGLGAQTDVDTPEVRHALAARLDDEDEDTRAEAFSGLSRRGDPRAR
jgi:HEAT repeat protein